MNILITGATGLVGKALIARLEDKNNLTLVGRHKEKLEQLTTKPHHCVTWEELDLNTIRDLDVVINLAGENIGAKKWSAKQKQIILDSRLHTTQRLAELCAELGSKSPLLINASAIGAYGAAHASMKSTPAIETDRPNPQQQNYLSGVAQAWESALAPAIDKGVRTIITRFAVILDKKEGALAKMLPSFRFGGGAVLGDGQQPFSWVSIDDLASALCFLMTLPDASGIYNIVADEVVTQNQLAQTLAKTLKRPLMLTMPKAVVRLLFGEMGQTLLLEGCNVSNDKLKRAGFSFQYPTIQAALEKILK